MRRMGIRCAVWFGLCFLLALSALASSADRKGQSSMTALITAAAREEVVRSGDPCRVMAIPDSPARAMRLQDGQLYLLATNNRNVPAIGQNFASATASCRSVGMGQEDADPYAFDDMFWVQAIAPAADGGIIGVSSHDYNGQRHRGACNSKAPGACWYSSILLAKADSQTEPFRLLPMPQRLLAVPQEPYNSSGSSRVGFFSVSNIVIKGQYAFMFVYAENTGGIRQGNCLLRARRDDLLTWRAFDGHDFTVDLSYAPGQTCAVVGSGRIFSPIRSVVWAEPIRKWVAIFQEGRGDREGVYYSVSDDLLSWSEKSFLLRAESPYRNPKCQKFYAYPSIIDESSNSAIFDTVSRAPSLFLTRFNFDDCSKDHIKRDLVRFLLKFDPPERRQ
jgi:hypothetical protein